MRLQRYLNEKYLGTSPGNSGAEIFVNPSRKEIKDAVDVSGYGYRFMIDFDDKKFYVWTDNAFHKFVMEWMRKNGHKEIPKFKEYWYNGKDALRFFTGSVDKGGSMHSDHIYFLRTNGYLEKLSSYDLTWLNTYIDIKKLKTLLQGN